MIGFLFGVNNIIANCDGLTFGSRTFCSTSGNDTTTDKFKECIEEAIKAIGLKGDPENILQRFQKNEEALIRMATQGKHKSIVNFLEKKRIARKYQRGDVAKALIAAYEIVEAPGGLYFFLFLSFVCLFCARIR